MQQDLNKCLLFEPKFPDDISEFVYKNCKYLYHSTERRYLARILKYGLVPKGKNGEAKYLYPDRIYCMHGNPEYLDKQQEDLIGRIRAAHENTKEFSLIIIPVNELPKGVKFYMDSQAHGGIYTYDNIPPNCLHVLNV